MAVEVRDNLDQNRFEAYVDGELAGFTEYRAKPGLIAFIHTAVDSEFEGQGVGSELIREAYIEKHPEYIDLVPESRREAFGL